MRKNRVLVLIDGFNYYHKLKEYQTKYNKCVKWLNYKSLAESWLTEDDDKEGMQIFTFRRLQLGEVLNLLQDTKHILKP